MLTKTGILNRMHTFGFQRKGRQQAASPLPKLLSHLKSFSQLPRFWAFMLAEIAPSTADAAAPQWPIATTIDDRTTTIAGRAQEPLSAATIVCVGPSRHDPFPLEIGNFRDLWHKPRQFSNIDLGCVVTNHMGNLNLSKPLRTSHQMPCKKLGHDPGATDRMRHALESGKRGTFPHINRICNFAFSVSHIRSIVGKLPLLPLSLFKPQPPQPSDAASSLGIAKTTRLEFLDQSALSPRV